MKEPRDAQQYWRTVFSKVIEEYQERKSTNGVSPCFSYESLGNRGGRATYTNPVRAVRPMVSDFICDVEIAANRALSNPLERKFFKAKYVQMRPVIVDDAVESMDRDIQVQVGRMFIARKIYPTFEYFAKVDCR